ncbi:GntP family permease [Sphingomonas sp. Leaf4]|uniref:GntP family permease n=1 Tax=Sphingomonas sp. Leaf4 TaxID=2876553 RepID=UPI001E363F6A|nr:gluconate:H+ symporter [Sphingomonas sp. Leaf4]
MTLLTIAAVIALLVVLVVAVRIPPFVAFIVTALVAAILLGIPLAAIPATIEKGIGDMLGPLAAIVVLGAVFGKLVADSGAAQRIAETLVALLGEKRLPLAMAATGFVVGIPLFYNVGFVLMVPLIFSVVRRTGLPAVYVGIPLLAGMSIAHGFLPPHPSPAALVPLFGADIGLTLIYGLIVGVPTLAIAGPLFARTLRHIRAVPAPLFATPAGDDLPLPGAGRSIACALLPVVLIAGATGLAHLSLPPGAHAVVTFTGSPLVVLLLSIVVALLALRSARGISLAQGMEGFVVAIRDIAPILLIIAGAGALKQVLIASGADVALTGGLSGLPVPPLVTGWLVACIIRIALGSATVAGLTAASLVHPLATAAGTDPNLMVLAIGAGSLMCSHVNDSGFWMFKEYFGLSLRDTFRSWSLMETLVGVFGLVFVLLLDMALRGIA